VSDLSGIRAKLIESTLEIFTSMIMMDISVKNDSLKQLGKHEKCITGMIGLAGKFKGVISIHVPENVAFAITSSFLGMEVDEINEDVQDAIGEIANMLGGNIKTILSGKGKDIQLSLPSTIFGDEYRLYSDESIDRIVIEFMTVTGTFFVELELEKSG